MSVEIEWVTEAISDLQYGDCDICNNIGVILVPATGNTSYTLACKCFKSIKYAALPKANEQQLFDASCRQIQETERLRRWAEDRGINFKGTDDQSRASFRQWFESVGSTGAMFAKGR